MFDDACIPYTDYEKLLYTGLITGVRNNFNVDEILIEIPSSIPELFDRTQSIKRILRKIDNIEKYSGVFFHNDKRGLLHIKNTNSKEHHFNKNNIKSCS